MIYAYVALTVTNPDKLAQYRAVAGEALARHKGSVLAVSGETTVLDGNPVKPDQAVIACFPEKRNALDWINDPELADVHALRRAAGGSDILLLG